MKAVVVSKHGGLDELRIEDVPAPAVTAGEVRVRVQAVALNHLDVWVRRGVPGHSFPLPLIAGGDGAGVVESVGAQVEGVAAGDEVIVSPGVSCGACVACLSGRDHHCPKYGILGEHRDGVMAELVVVPQANIVKKPATLSFPQAAAIGVPFLTAWHMLVARAGLVPGETVLVQAAGSGVSSAAIQIAKLWGGRVIAAARGQAKLERARELGADAVVDSTHGGVAKRVKELTAGRGVEVVIDHVGEATFDDSMRALGWRGRFVTCGATAGHEVKLNLRHVFFKSLSILGSTMGSKGELHQIVSHVAAGKLTPVVDRVLPLSEVRTAHRLLEERQVFGRVVLEVP